jgi:hypothetical protein
MADQQAELQGSQHDSKIRRAMCKKRLIASSLNFHYASIQHFNIKIVQQRHFNPAAMLIIATLPFARMTQQTRRARRGGGRPENDPKILPPVTRQ